MIWQLHAERLDATSVVVTSPSVGGKLFLVSGERRKNRDEFREPLTGTATTHGHSMGTKQERTVVTRSIRIVCTGLIAAFTVGLVSVAADDVATDRPAARHSVTASGFDWDSAPASPPAQS
ncbi:hypothetical protein [Kitasatospora saccharophila]|uniref:hypothetical protein n=1 Tax=Kitasatospora saccharophila TaxID=407973 RepID=UPI0031DF0229